MDPCFMNTLISLQLCLAYSAYKIPEVCKPPANHLYTRLVGGSPEIHVQQTPPHLSSLVPEGQLHGVEREDGDAGWEREFGAPTGFAHVASASRWKL